MTPQQALAFLREQFDSGEPTRGCHIGPKQVFILAQQAFGILEKSITQDSKMQTNDSDDQPQ